MIQKTYALISLSLKVRISECIAFQGGVSELSSEKGEIQSIIIFHPAH